MSRASVGSLAAGVAEQLADSGFRDVGGRRYRRDDMVLDARGPWWTFRCPAAPTSDKWLDRPGLWKIADQHGAVQACDLPAWALGLDSAELSSLLTWVEATRRDPIEMKDEQVDRNLSGDESAQTPAVDPQELSARVGPFTCQGKLICQGSRLWVDYPLSALPDARTHVETDDQTQTRRHWLQAILFQARQLRMVRVETGSSSKSIHVRLDLTGVPSVWRGPLLTQGMACLRSAVEGLLPSITFLTTPSVTSRAMELGSLVPNLKESRHD